MQVIRVEPSPTGSAAGRSWATLGLPSGGATASSGLCFGGLCPKPGCFCAPLAQKLASGAGRGLPCERVAPLAGCSAPCLPEDKGVLAAEAFPGLLGTFFCSLLPVLCSEGVCGFDSQPLCEAGMFF